MQESLYKQSIAQSVFAGVVALLLSVTPAFAESPQANKFYNQGIDAYTQGNVNEAMRLFNEATKIDPTYADAHYNIGSIYFQQNNFPKAKEAFRQAIKNNPNDFQAKYNLALTLEQLKEYNEALSLFQTIPMTDSKYDRAQQKAADITRLLANNSPSPAQPSYPNYPSQPVSSQPVNSVPGGYAPQYDVETFSRGFFGPTGMVIGPGGYLFVANYSKHSIYKVGANGEKEIFVQGEGLKGPVGLTFNPKTQDMYVANYLENTVSRVAPDGKISTLASGLKKPYNLYLDGVNNVLYVSEQETNTISKISLQ